MDEAEAIVLHPAANRSLEGRSIGGRLFVTNRRLIFSPNLLEWRNGQLEWCCSLDARTGIASAERTLKKPLSGGVRRRLTVTLEDGTQELFVMNHLDRVAAALGRVRDPGR